VNTGIIITDADDDIETLLTGDTKRQMDIRAYCVLGHAAIEEFFESIAMAVFNNAIDLWTRKSVSWPLLALALYHGYYEPRKEEKLSLKREAKVTFMHSAVAKLKEYYPNQIHQNHGARLDHLINIFNPIGIEIPDKPFIGSLESFASWRGDFAHKGMTAQRISSATSVHNSIQDILILCFELKDAAKQVVA